MGYIPGFVVYAKARKDQGEGLGRVDKVGIVVVTALGVLSLVLLGMGIISL